MSCANEELNLNLSAKENKANCTYIVGCGENSIRQVLEGEIRCCIYFYEGHLPFDSGFPPNLNEFK